MPPYPIKLPLPAKEFAPAWVEIALSDKKKPSALVTAFSKMILPLTIKAKKLSISILRKNCWKFLNLLKTKADILNLPSLSGNRVKNQLLLLKSMILKLVKA